MGMAGEEMSEFVTECLWPDVRESDLRALDARVPAAAERLAGRGASVSFSYKALAQF